MDQKGALIKGVPTRAILCRKRSMLSISYSGKICQSLRLADLSTFLAKTSKDGQHKEFSEKEVEVEEKPILNLKKKLIGGSTGIIATETN